MNAVCVECGDTGYHHLLVYCRGCKDCARHLYCFEEVIFDGSSANWLCLECQETSGAVTCNVSLDSVPSEGSSHAHSDSTLQQPITEEVESENVNPLSQKCDTAENDNIEDTLLTGDLRDSTASNCGPARKQRRHVGVNEDEGKGTNGVEETEQAGDLSNPNASNGVEETVQTGELSNSDASHEGTVKKRRRYMNVNDDEDEEVVIDVANASSAQNASKCYADSVMVVNEDEDKGTNGVEETKQTGDLSNPNASNGVEETVQTGDLRNPNASNGVEETVQTGELSNSDASNEGTVKKRRRYIDVNDDEDEEAVIDVANASSAQNDVANCALNGCANANLEPQTAVAKDSFLNFRMASDSDSADQQHNIYLGPIAEPVWSGVFKVNNEVSGKLDAHLSNKACQKVWAFSKMLQPEVEVKKIARLKAWPKSWRFAPPTVYNIGFFFFPHN